MLLIGPKAHSIDHSLPMAMVKADIPTVAKTPHPKPKGTSKDPLKKYLPILPAPPSSRAVFAIWKT